MYVVPPANVWRHLRQIEGSNIHIAQLACIDFVLECLKAMYGLGDAPLAWQHLVLAVDLGEAEV